MKCASINFHLQLFIYQNSFTWFCKQIMNGIHNIFCRKNIFEQMKIVWSFHYIWCNQSVSNCTKKIYAHRPYVDNLTDLHKKKNSNSMVYIWSTKFEFPAITCFWDALIAQSLSHAQTHIGQLLKIRFSDSEEHKTCNFIKNSVSKILLKNSLFSFTDMDKRKLKGSGGFNVGVELR